MKSHGKSTSTARRQIPAVEKVLQALGELDLPRRVVVDLVRRELAGYRKSQLIPDVAVMVDRVKAVATALRSTRIRPVINATGVLIHTNLGRAPLGRAVVEAVAEVASQYNNLEYDLNSGARGQRAGYLEQNLTLLCEAQAATAVNNCAAALVLIVHHFTRQKKEVVVSRGELVQIGGGFRIPEILEASGARLREVGTTNRTSLHDYRRAISKETGLVLSVHRSNFFMDGFVASPSLEELSALARAKRIPFAYDLGSGAIIPTEEWTGGDHEPTPAEILDQGADLVCFSGDKLMGGPQAGLIGGRLSLIRGLKQDPLYRAFRCDKLILAALEATVDLYLTDRAGQIPIVEMLNTSVETLRQRADNIIAGLEGLPATVIPGTGKGQLGGGTMPRARLASVTVDVAPRDLPLAELARRLRRGPRPVVGYISGGRFKLDLRTVWSSQDPELIGALRAALQG